MLHSFSRTELLLGADGMERLARAHVAVFGLGGVGSYTGGALARSGVGTLTLVDDDNVCLTNINRQLIATHKTIGRSKTDVTRERALEINPSLTVNTRECFFTAENAGEFDFTQYDYVVDAIDTVSSKILLVQLAQKAGAGIISCMGAGNKLDPTRFEVADIYQTSICPLARVMRKELRARGVAALKVVYSKEPPLTPLETEDNNCRGHCVCPPETMRTCASRRQVPGSIAFVPPVAGFILAGEVIRDLAFGTERLFTAETL